jgi:hypothetical protein
MALNPLFENTPARKMQIVRQHCASSLHRVVQRKVGANCRRAKVKGRDRKSACAAEIEICRWLFAMLYAVTFFSIFRRQLAFGCNNAEFFKRFAKLRCTHYFDVPNGAFE